MICIRSPKNRNKTSFYTKQGVVPIMIKNACQRGEVVFTDKSFSPIFFFFFFFFFSIFFFFFFIYIYIYFSTVEIYIICIYPGIISYTCERASVSRITFFDHAVFNIIILERYTHIFFCFFSFRFFLSPC